MDVVETHKVPARRAVRSLALAVVGALASAGLLGGALPSSATALNVGAPICTDAYIVGYGLISGDGQDNRLTVRFLPHPSDPSYHYVELTDSAPGATISFGDLQDIHPGCSGATAQAQCTLSMRGSRATCLVPNVGFMKLVLRLGDGNDTLDFANAPPANAYFYNVLAGGSGSDTIRGADGVSDFISGEGDNDVLDGGSAADWLYGGAGTDIVDYSRRTDGVTVTLSETEGQGGNDTVDHGTPVHQDMPLDTLAGVEWVVGGSANDVLVGNSASNLLLGGAGNDTIVGGAGQDFMFGGVGGDTIFDELFGLGGGNDLIYGDDGKDKLYGQTDNDTINGGKGHDELYGGAGNDTLTSGGDPAGWVFHSDLVSCGAGTDTARYNTVVYADQLVNNPAAGDVCEILQVLN